MPIFRLAPLAACLFSSLFTLNVFADTPQTSFPSPHGMTVTVKQIGPVTQTTDLQIITLLKHNPQGDQYIEAMQDFNDKQGGLLQALRERGEFIGELGETFLYTPPGQSITPRQVLLIGVGDEKNLSLESLRLAGRIAIREAVRLNAHHVSFAPTLRDQGSSVIEVGAGDAAVVEEGLLAYDTEKRLQAQGLAPAFDIQEWVIEAGPKYYQSVNTQIDRAIQQVSLTLQKKGTEPYVAASKK
ncbi:M17 family peptidase N-terminal domain-containing protein [Methylovorus glucosotrophus]|jgi:hypothetical protein|uniref:Peptidase M17 leucyl aminopeptidase domain protein n=1 Tax=Methylovorus glucosotrophus (strain SIP3-4) TaxID=582744 RepID=C6XBF4_METGS|nr:M17 family peptidase N-terminal domain-containing protein [Methylovorus glucosotrophus]ACT51924.1 peptidase M17 leucyl aminopeptidase domain protein [Methylovorus glucosotrophus SIP3-4]